MTIEILLFGPAAIAAGADRVAVTMHAPSATGGVHPTVREVAAALLAQHPVLGFALSPPRLAVNRAFVAPGTIVVHGDEVALVTLVGGG